MWYGTFLVQRASCSVVLSCMTYSTYKFPARLLSLSKQAHEDTQTPLQWDTAQKITVTLITTFFFRGNILFHSFLKQVITALQGHKTG